MWKLIYVNAFLPSLVVFLTCLLHLLSLSGYTIFVVEGSLPACEADQLLSLVSIHPPSSSSLPGPSPSYQPSHLIGRQMDTQKEQEEEEGFALDLATAMSASMAPRKPHTTQGTKWQFDSLPPTPPPPSMIHIFSFLISNPDNKKKKRTVEHFAPIK